MLYTRWILMVAIATASLPTAHSAFPYATNAQGQRIYMIKVDINYGAYAYLGPDGVAKGLFYDLIAAVCAEMGMDCRTVYDPDENCAISAGGQHTRAGRGLMDRWYDGCMGWSPTTQRNAIFTFSESFIKGRLSSFYVKADDTSFNPDDFKQKTIVFMDGYVDDVTCLARTTGVVVEKSKVKLVKSVEEFVDAINTGKADAGYGGDLYMDVFVTGNNPPLKKVGKEGHCELRGGAMMARKDNGDFIAMWNEGFLKLVSSGKFQKMCEEAKAKHSKDGGMIKCV